VKTCKEGFKIRGRRQNGRGRKKREEEGRVEKEGRRYE
jgi:hypothetical protein